MAVNPDGRTRVMGVVGHPIEQVKGPESWSRLFEVNDVNVVCVPMHVSPADFPGFLTGIRPMHNLVGLVITIPHKPVALTLCRATTERAARIGSVNLMRADPAGGWFGDITDGAGMVAGLRARGHDLRGLRTLLVGTGGAGRAIAVAVAEAGVSELCVSDLVPERAEEVSRLVASTGTASSVGPADATGFDLVINCTPVGMRPGDGMAIDLSRVKESAIVADVVVKPEMTPLLVEAERRGCQVQPGKFMMNNQLALIADFFGLTEYGADLFTADSVEQLVHH